MDNYVYYKKMKDSIYVLAMEIGSQFPDGITFEDLVKNIESKLGKSLSMNSKYGLVEWFVDAFTTSDWIRSSSSAPLESYRSIIPSYFRVKHERYELTFRDFQRARFVLSGNTFKQYVDYLELKESREQAKKANRTALISIIIAMITLVISILFPFFTEPIPKPPFEVRVINANGINQDLEKQTETMDQEIQYEKAK